MNSNDRQAIERFFTNLAEVDSASPSHDGEAESFIRNSVDQQPGAPYYMAQTIVVQEQALEAAQDHINELEARLADARSSSGGILARLFDRGRSGPTSVPRAGSRRMGVDAAAGRREQGGGRFLAGAAQTEMGRRAACCSATCSPACSAAARRHPRRPGIGGPGAGLRRRGRVRRTWTSDFSCRSSGRSPQATSPAAVATDERGGLS